MPIVRRIAAALAGHQCGEKRLPSTGYGKAPVDDGSGEPFAPNHGEFRQRAACLAPDDRLDQALGGPPLSTFVRILDGAIFSLGSERVLERDLQRPVVMSMNVPR